MKKVLFGILGLGAIVSLVVVMSCGGSGSSGGPADAGSAAVAAAVADVAGTVTPVPSEVNVNTSEDLPINDTFDCPIAGTAAITGNFTVNADTTTFSYTGTFAEVLTNCTVYDDTFANGGACGFGNVVGNGTLNGTVDGSGTETAFTISETIKGTGLTFLYDGKTLTCDIDLALSLDSSTTWDEATVKNAITGTVCTADWAAILAAEKDATAMAALCTAFDAQAASL